MGETFEYEDPRMKIIIQQLGNISRVKLNKVQTAKAASNMCKFKLFNTP